MCGTLADFCPNFGTTLAAVEVGLLSPCVVVVLVVVLETEEGAVTGDTEPPRPCDVVVVLAPLVPS